ncbi:MAG: flagellar hook-associated protein FlgK [Eubacteriales bacterium]
MASVSSLSRAISGLDANQRALNVTAHNLSNVDTPGYVRQQALFKDSSYTNVGNNFQLGLGTDIQAIRQVRDQFLDEAFRNETGRQGYYLSKYEAIQELETIFGEIEGESFSEVLNSFWNSLNELSKQPEGLETRGTFVQSAVMLIDRANLISDQINDYQLNLNQQIKDTVDEINQIGEDIVTLNEKISRYEAFGDRANDLRDERNNSLDRLAHLVDISYKEDNAGRVSVLVEGLGFVDENRVSKMTLEQAEPNSPLVKPVWEEYGHDVFNFSKSISSENDNDIGSLKGLLLARGTRTANYTDMENQAHYEENIKSSMIMNAQAQFDNLIHGIATLINDTLAPNTTTGSIQLDTGSAPYGIDGSRGTELFKREHYDRYDATGEYIEEDSNDVYTLYSAGNIVINPEILKDYDKIALSKTPTDIGDNSIVEDIIEKWKAPFSSIEPGGSSIVNYTEYYSAFVSGLGHEGNLANKMQTNQKTMVNQIDNQRSKLMGVSNDEELGNMMKYQHAYNASAKVINTVDDMLEHVISRLGIVGR